MLKLQEILNAWQVIGEGELCGQSFTYSLNAADQQRLENLKSLYPKLTEEQIARDLISLALAELEQGMPYVAGDKVVGIDELGDEIYEDVGLTAKFIALSREKGKELKPVNK